MYDEKSVIHTVDSKEGIDMGWDDRRLDVKVRLSSLITEPA